MEKNSSEYADGQQENDKAIHSFMDIVAGEAEQHRELNHVYSAW